MFLRMKENIFCYSKGFRKVLLTKEHEDWIDEVYSKLSKKLKKLINKKGVMIGYSPENFPDKDEISYFIKPNLIEFNKKYWKKLIIKDFFMGSFAHELGHFYYFNLNPIFRFIYLKRFKGDEELIADHLGYKIGFKEEINVRGL